MKYLEAEFNQDIKNVCIIISCGSLSAELMHFV